MRLTIVLKKLIFIPRTEKSFANHLLNDTENRKFRKPVFSTMEMSLASLSYIHE